MSGHRSHARDERGVYTVMFALLIPVILGIGALVITVGSWYTHARHLQTKVDAAAFAGGDAWSLPCLEGAGLTTTTSQQIIDAARRYVGIHTEADGSLYTGTTFNPQVGGIRASRIHVVLNGNGFWTDSSSPADLSDGSTTVCTSGHLDVKATEDNSPNLFRYLPFFPDIKRKARVELQQASPEKILPISVKVPKPVSAAAVFYNEASGVISRIQYFCEPQNPPGSGNDLVTVPPGSGLGGWTTGATSDPTCSYTSSNTSPVSVNPETGVVVATSFVPRCADPTAVPPNCLSDNFIGQNINNFCQQGPSSRIAQCFYATGSGSTQTAQSGLQFIRGYSPGGIGQPTDPPKLSSVYLDGMSATCGAAFNATTAYFNDPPIANVPCRATLHASIDFGSALNLALHPGAAAQVKYGQVYGDTVAQGEESCFPSGQGFTGGNHNPNCDMGLVGSNATATVTLDPHFNSQGDPVGVRHAFVMMIQLKNTTIGTGANQIVCGNNFGATCSWYYWDNSGAQSQGAWPTTNAGVDVLVFTNPLQRAFTGDPDITGPIRWLQLYSDPSCVGSAGDGSGQAASQTTGSHCFYLEMGLKGAIARDQSEPPFAFNFKGSQSGAVDCDPVLVNFKTETEVGCGPDYVNNEFSHDPPCPWPDGTTRNWSQFQQLSGASWTPPRWNPPFDCLLTAGPPSNGQVDKGLRGRLFTPPGSTNFNIGEQATTCPADNATKFVAGRNYWSDGNNLSGGAYAFAKRTNPGAHSNNIGKGGTDPRLVTLFMTSYNSFNLSGQDHVYPIVTFGSFYITGWGHTNGSNGRLTIDDPCPGSSPPADLVNASGTSGAEYVWGHFINNVLLTSGGRPTGKACNIAQFAPCIAVLVQ